MLDEASQRTAAAHSYSATHRICGSPRISPRTGLQLCGVCTTTAYCWWSK